MMNQVGMEPYWMEDELAFFEFWHGGERSSVSQEVSGD